MLAGDAVHAFAGPALLPAGSDYVQDTRAQRPPPSGRGRRATDITQFYGGAHFAEPAASVSAHLDQLRARTATLGSRVAPDHFRCNYRDSPGWERRFHRQENGCTLWTGTGMRDRAQYPF